jgi:hypothetical protein
MTNEHLFVMKNLVRAHVLYVEARELIGDCFINRLTKNDPLSSVTESIWNVLWKGGTFPIECLDTDGCIDLLKLAGKAITEAQEDHG